MSDDTDGFVVFLCDGATCSGRSAVRALHTELGQLVAREGLQGRVQIDRETCFGHCRDGPNLMICPTRLALSGPPLPGTPGAVLHHHVTATTAMAAIMATSRGEPAPGPALTTPTQRNRK